MIFVWKVSRFFFTLLRSNLKLKSMSQRKKSLKNKRAEEKANRTVKVIFISLIVLAVLMLVYFSFS